MDLWDRMCCILRARIVSVEDVSNKVSPGHCHCHLLSMSVASKTPPMSPAELNVKEAEVCKQREGCVAASGNTLAGGSWLHMPAASRLTLSMYTRDVVIIWSLMQPFWSFSGSAAICFAVLHRQQKVAFAS